MWAQVSGGCGPEISRSSLQPWGISPTSAGSHAQTAADSLEHLLLSFAKKMDFLLVMASLGWAKNAQHRAVMYLLNVINVLKTTELAQDQRLMVQELTASSFHLLVLLK